LLVLDGAGSVSCGSDVLQCKKGNSLFVTADSGMTYLSGNLQVLCTRIGTI
jgi:mannose-6-phosphate isomerase class I